MKLAVENEWGEGLIRSWNDADWYPAPQRVGASIAKLIGAQSDEVIVCDSTSVNLYKVLLSALQCKPERKVILGETGNFPTDAYIAQGIADLHGAKFVALDREAILDSIDESVAIVSLTHVNYRSGAIYDMKAITDRAHACGALVVWDLAHTAGAMPCDLNGCNVDFAVGCGYKYLNGGPGAPAFVFAARRLHSEMIQPIQGWHGHSKPFDFVHGYVPGQGMDKMLVGTAPQLSLIALESALTAFDGVDMHEIRRKSVGLTTTFIALVEQEIVQPGLLDLGLLSPRNADERGSQVALTHEHGYAMMQALIARGVIGDFRAPNILRFGFASLYVSYEDVWNAVRIFKDILLTKAWRNPEFQQRKAVT